MVMLVTLQEVKDNLRVDNDDADNNLTGKIHAASGAILSYLKKSGLAYEYLLDTAGDAYYDTFGDPFFLLDTAGDKVVLPQVKEAVLIMVGVLWNDPNAQNFIEGEKTQSLGELTLPRTVKWILDPLRRPLAV